MQIRIHIVCIQSFGLLSTCPVCCDLFPLGSAVHKPYEPKSIPFFDSFSTLSVTSSTVCTREVRNRVASVRCTTLCCLHASEHFIVWCTYVVRYYLCQFFNFVYQSEAHPSYNEPGSQNKIERWHAFNDCSYMMFSAELLTEMPIWLLKSVFRLAWTHILLSNVFYTP
jgi:hypothetical protein